MRDMDSWMPLGQCTETEHHPGICLIHGRGRVSTEVHGWVEQGCHLCRSQSVGTYLVCAVHD